MNLVGIIPAHNESGRLGPVLRGSLSHLDHVVVVDDGSTDGTEEIARSATAHTLRHKVNLGKGAALATGCEYAFSALSADAVVLLDADGQHDPADIPRFRAALEAGFPLVLGVRTRQATAMPGPRRWVNRIAGFGLRVLLNGYFPDVPCGFRAFQRSVWSSIRWRTTGYGVETEMALRAIRAKIPFAEVPIATVYLDINRGMSILEALRIGVRVPLWMLRR